MSLIHELVIHFRVSPSDLLRIISTAPARYKEYTIPKRKGGIRVIAQPSREVKALQRYILGQKLSTLPIHPAATGYVKGRNIFQNAEYHQSNRVILKLDFVDLFPSIKVGDWDFLLRTLKTPLIQRDESSFYKNILFWGQGSRVARCLAIGAPSSATLSNIMMFRLDTRLARIAERLKVAYTRYADDITTISGGSIEYVLRFEASFLRIIKDTKSPALTFNDEKRGIYLKGQRRMVTGLLITPNREISIGRERKRLISVMLHKVLIDALDPSQMGYLKGMCGFV
jgi:RNA-directed DNA polymerase